ncbi:hypothetical protein HSX10_17490 [Winogradskyella undariae]|uniref:hypothetical protein n=1 Tax=Winogradskyella undariae TaxID=1285465 RepID=UPI00156BD211|nr:hypothetical protein [Winogradskyella undariae]NRR93371.1 hypothetical protein [Winogradskyella undariae]
MKNLIIIALFVCLIIGCSEKKEQPLNQKIEQFRVSECRTDCGIDSIGVWTNNIENNLNVKLGYIVNCSWDSAFFKNITETNDTLIVELDMPNVNGEYPITECDCFFFFEFMIKNYNKEPKAIRVAELFGKNKFWDERRIPEIEETIIETE